jgi:hypothetical protein
MTPERLPKTNEFPVKKVLWIVLGAVTRGTTPASSIVHSQVISCHDITCYASAGHAQSNRWGSYFSLLGGTRPFSRKYNANVAYCSLSWETFPHSKLKRDPLNGPACSISVMLASVKPA